MTEQMALPIEVPGLVVSPTPAMRQGTQSLAQCAHCGVVVAVPSSEFSAYRHDDRLAACPRCGRSTWWRQKEHCGPFRLEVGS